MAASSAVSLASISAGVLKQPDQYAGQNLQVHNFHISQTEACATLGDVTGKVLSPCAAAVAMRLWHTWALATDANVC